jgi:hypothetical protein
MIMDPCKKYESVLLQLKLPLELAGAVTIIAAVVVGCVTPVRWLGLALGGVAAIICGLCLSLVRCIPLQLRGRCLVFAAIAIVVLTIINLLLYIDAANRLAAWRAFGDDAL